MPKAKYSDLYRAVVFWMRRKGDYYSKIDRVTCNPSSCASASLMDRMRPEQQDACEDLRDEAERVIQILTLRSAGLSIERIAVLVDLRASDIYAMLQEHFPDVLGSVPRDRSKRPEPTPAPKHTCAYMVVTPYGVEPCGEVSHGTYCKAHHQATAPYGNRFKDMRIGSIVA